MAKSILVPASAIDSTLKRLQRLAGKAGVTLEQIPGETHYYRLASKLHRSNVTGQTWKTHIVDQSKVLVCARLTIGEMPATNGYSFVGKIAHTEAGNILCLAQNDNLPAVTLDAWRAAKPTCDHCATQRNRKDTFLIACPDGSVKRVGRQCLRDFVQADPAALVAAAEFEDSLRILEESDPDEPGFGGGWTLASMHFLACAVRCTEAEGFHKSNEEGATVGRAYFAAGDKPRDPHSAESWRRLQPTEDSFITVIGIYSWLADLQDTSDYIHNLKTACLLPDVRRVTAGLLASAPSAYARAMGAIAEAKAPRPQAGNWQSVGERADTTVTIVRISHCDTQFGTSTIVGMRTPEGHDLVTFTTSSSAPKTEDIGRTFAIRGTVKAHKPYNGKPQTTLTRVSFERVA